MSVERIQLLHEDYIRLTERFKALWTFHQFLRGIQKTFFATEPSYVLDFGKLYDDVRAVASAIDTTSPEKVAPRIRELAERLDVFSKKLREADRHISPSYVRRFFEKVQPQDEKIAFHLLRFYFSQPDVDEDVVDKVDFLATVDRGGPVELRIGPPPSRTCGSSSSPLRRRSVWPRLDSTDGADDRAGVRRSGCRHDPGTGVRGPGDGAPPEQRADPEAPGRERSGQRRGARRRGHAATSARARSSTASTSEKSSGWRRPPTASATSRRS